MVKYDMTMIHGVMEKGENIEWIGNPEDFDLMEQPYGKQVVKRLVGGIVLAVVLATLIILYQTNYHNASFTAILAIVSAFVVTMISLRPILDRNSMLNKHVYIITNKRCILCRSTAKSDYVAMNIDTNTDVVVVAGKNGKGSICIGSGVKTAEISKLRKWAVMPKTVTTENNEFVTGMVFYNVSDPERVKEALKGAIAKVA